MGDPELHTIDGGRQAWTFLIASVAVEGLLYGFQASYGVLLKFYRENASFGTHPFLPFVGLLSIGMQKLGAPVVAPFIIRHPQFRTHLIWSGWIVCVVSLVASSCASELWHLALSIGVAFSLGFSILYYPMLNMLNDWWYVRRGFAYGIQFGLAGVISTVLPFALAPLLEALGGSWTLLLYAGVTFIIGGPTVYLLRAPAKAQLSAPRILNKMDRSVFRQIGFTAMTLSNVFQGLVYSIPAVFLPVYASAVGLSSIQGTVILSVTNFAITVGQLGTGYLADIVDSRILMGVLPLLSALVVFVFWGPGQTLIRLVAFGLLFGLFSGGYIVLYTRFSTALADDRATQTWLYTIFDVQRGVAIIVGGAIGGGLVHGTINLGDYGAGEYKALIIFCGACFVASSLGGIGWFFRGRSFRVPRRWRKNTKAPVAPSQSMEQLLSAIEHHIWLDAEKGYFQSDNGTHQRYLQSIRHAIRRQRTLSVSSFVSRSSVYSTDFPSSTSTLKPFPLQVTRPKAAMQRGKASTSSA